MRGPWTWGEELNKLDLAVYAAIAVTPTPAMDVALRRLSRAANYSRLWLGCSAVIAACGGERGRRAAENGLASIALTSAVVNLVLKPLGNRRRPDRQRYDVPIARQVTMPDSTSWPSGHAASAFAFASGVSSAWPQAGIPLGAVAALVAYSRVHTGVHYASDTIAGTVCGVALAPATVAAVERRREQLRRRSESRFMKLLHDRLARHGRLVDHGQHPRHGGHRECRSGWGLRVRSMTGALRRAR